MAIGTKISDLRKKHKFSQPELAFKLDISQTTLSEIESGKTKKIDFLLMDKICKEFEVGFDYFLEDNPVYNVNKNIGGVVGNSGTVNIIPEGILENMLKRIENLEHSVNR